MKKQRKCNPPEFLRPYFWDVEFNDLDIEKSKFFIVKRVIDRGNTSAVKFVIKTYGLDAIREVVINARDLCNITGNFWADMLNLDKSRIPSLQKIHPLRQNKPLTAADLNDLSREHHCDNSRV